MAGHASGNRMDGITDLGVVFLKKFAQFLRYMLGLGNRQAIARNNGNRISSFQDIVDVFCRSRPDLSFLLS